MSLWFHFVVLVGLSVIIVNASKNEGTVKFITVQQNDSSKSQAKSLNEYAKEKLASLQNLRNQLVQQHQKQLNNRTNKVEPLNEIFALSAKKPFQDDEKEVKTSVDDARQSFWSSILPRTDILKRLSRMRKKLEPNLRSYLTTKYNDFLTNLVDYSDNIGVPPYVLNSMKIPQNFDPRWNFIEQLLETSSLEKFLTSLPELASLAKHKMMSGNSDDEVDVVQGRSDDDFISDQEPQATSKGKKKYGGGLRLSNRVKVYRNKGDSEYGGPHRTGYEYGNGVGDQYGLYSHSSYDTSYGKGYDDYYSPKPIGGSDKGYIDYSGKSSIMKGMVGKYTGLGLGFAYPDSYAAAGQQSYSYGSSNGGGSSLTGYLDPFSVLGGLAFLVYLGLLFQQSLNNTGRAMSGSSIFDTAYRKPIVLTQLPFEELDEPSPENFRRKTRSIQRVVDDLDTESVVVLEHFWNEIEGLSQIQNPECRQQESCHIIKDLHECGILNVFKDEIAKYEKDQTFLEDHYNRLQVEGGRVSCDLNYRCGLEIGQNLLHYNPI